MAPDALSSTSRNSDEERRLRLIIEATPNAMLMVDAEGRIVLVNSQTESLFGYPRDELLAMRVDDLIPERFRSGHQASRRAFFEQPDTRVMGAGRDLYGLRADGTEVPIEIGLNPLSTDEGMFVLASIINITERKRSEERLLQVVEAAPNAMIMVNEQGRIVLVNTQAERSFGYSREELLAMSVDDLVPERFRAEHGGARGQFFTKPSRREMGMGRELYGLRSDGSEMPIEIGLNPIQVMDEHFVLASVIDITERTIAQTAEAALRQDTMRRAILDSLPFSIVATDPDGTVVTANPAAERLLGYRQEELVGSTLREIRGDPPERADDWPGITATAGAEREWVYLRKDGTPIPVNEAVAPMRTEDGTPSGFLTVAYDITQRIQAQAEVRHMATHDVLTDLPNRTMLRNHLADVIAQAGRADEEIVVLLLDLDHFKRVNDSLGHHMGDELLLTMAERLRQWVDEDDLVARLGGDEFVIVFRGVPDGKAVTPRIEDLLQVVLASTDVQGHEIVVTVSMGAVRYPQDGSDPTALLKNADTAMYQAKSAGRNNFQWFNEAMLDEAHDKMAIAAALRQAIDREELSVVYQPQVDLGTGEVVGMEALARWESPDLGTIGPDRFIPVAEESGMIGQLGQWVLRRACRDSLAIQAELGRPLKLAVNVSPRQFHSPDWWTVVNRVLNDTGFDPGRLELEITEGILMEGPHDVIDLLHAFRMLGIRIVVDDFGTGFSSLAYLTRFPIDKIKIDRSFVRAMHVDDTDAAIVDTIIVMAHTLGMTVVAEGVETDEQERYLQRRAADEAQGYLYGPGVPPERFAEAADAITAVVPWEGSAP